MAWSLNMYPVFSSNYITYTTSGYAVKLCNLKLFKFSRKYKVSNFYDF